MGDFEELVEGIDRAYKEGDEDLIGMEHSIRSIRVLVQIRDES